MDVRRLELKPDHYSTIIVMGNTLGVHQTPATLPALLRDLATATRRGGHLFSIVLDPLDTDSPRHLRYHRRNRENGEPPGMSVIRLKYRGMVDDWIRLWMPTRDEFLLAVEHSGWSLAEEAALGPQRFRLLERR